MIFELVNEPEIESVKAEMQGIYNHARSLAPDTHMILWSFFDPSEITADEIKAATPTIDYQNDNVSVGWHNYWGMGNMTGWNRAETFADAGLPVINTEFWSLADRDNLPISYGNIAENVRIGESLGRSYILWAPYLNYEAKNKGYTHDQLKFTSEFKDAVRNGAYTIASQDHENNIFGQGLNGQYWDTWSPSINPDAGSGSSGSSGGSTGVTNNDVSFANPPSVISLSGDISVQINYSAPGDRDLVLEVFNQNSGAWLGQGKKEVSYGSGTIEVSASVGTLSAGTYKIKIGIRNRGGQWYDSHKDVYHHDLQASNTSGNNNGSGSGSTDTKPMIAFNASEADALSDGVQAWSGWGVGYFGPGRWVKFSQVDLGVGGYSQININLATSGEAVLEVRAQSPSGPLLTTLSFSGASFGEFSLKSASFPRWEHPQDLYFTMKSGWANMGNVQIIDN